MKNILISGGAGFVGSNIANTMLNNGHEVTVYDNLSRRGVIENLKWLKSNHTNLSFVKADIRDYDTLLKHVKNSDAVYHLASQVAVTTSILNPREDFEINALGTLNVLEAIRNSPVPPHLIFTSTNKVYGAMEHTEIEKFKNRWQYKYLRMGVNEKTPLSFCSPYGCSKGSAEQYVLDYAKTYNLKTAVFRMSCIYGTRQFGNEDQGWVAHFIISALLKKPITIYGDGKQLRDILYIDDLVNLFRIASDNIDKIKGNAYNVGGGRYNTISLLELIEYIEELTGGKIEYSFEDWRVADQKVYYSDIFKLSKNLNWEPLISKEEGIQKLYIWIKDNLDTIKKVY